MSYYLKDSSSVVWVLGVTTLGQLTTTVSSGSVVPLVLQDSSGNYWQLGVTTLGQITLTSVGATSTTTITLTDSSSNQWLVGVTTLGQWTTQELSSESINIAQFPVQVLGQGTTSARVSQLAVQVLISSYAAQPNVFISS